MRYTTFDFRAAIGDVERISPIAGHRSNLGRGDRLSLASTTILVSTYSLIILYLAFWTTPSVLAWRTYDWRDVGANFVLGAGHVVAGSLTFEAISSFYDVLYEKRIMNIEWGLASVAGLFLLEDLCYYCFHRASHTVRVWWSAHSVHHSSRYFNLSVALRQPWTGRLAGQFLFWAPLSLLGFSPEWIYWQGCISLSHQFWIHLEGVGRLPALIEAIVNTPQHHRLHHATNPEYRDKNFGGVLIVWDRLFGSFATPSGETEMTFQTAGTVTYHPLAIAFSESVRLVRDFIKEPSAKGRFAVVFGRP